MKREAALFALIALVSGVMSVSLFSNGHLWWDDFAAYILQAQAILDGSMGDFVAINTRIVTESTYPVGPAAYPWGYPLLLAPVLALIGQSLAAFKFINTLSYCFTLTVVYLYARQRFPWTQSIALAALLAFNPAMLSGHDLILSDFPFLFAASLAILLIDRQWQTGLVAWQKILLGGIVFWAVFLRTNGILLFGPLLLVDSLQRRSAPAPGFRFAALPYLTFILLLLPSFLVFPNGQGTYFSHYGEFFSPARLIDNLFYYLTLPGWMFEGLPFPGLLYTLAGLACLWGIWQKARADLPALTFSLFTLALFISWPERQGLRFIYPILPFFLVFSLYGLRDLAARVKVKSPWSAHLPSVLFGLLALLSLLVTFQNTGGGLFQRQEINGPFDPVSAEMFAYIREQTPADSTVIFFKPRAMRLLGERLSLLLEDCSRLDEGDYVVIHEKQEGNGQVSPSEVTTCNPSIRLETVFENKRFTVYQVDP